MSESYALTEIRPLIGDLVLRALNGESSVITRYGQPAAMLVPAAPQAPARAKQLSDYFRLLLSLAEQAKDKQRRDDLFNRIERTIAAMAAECASGEPPQPPNPTDTPILPG